MYRAVAEEDAIGIQCKRLLCGEASWHDSDPAAKGCKPPQNIVLDAKIICHHLAPPKAWLSHDAA